MFNNYLADEARHEIKRRAQEAETYSLHKRLGYGDNQAARWVLAFLLVMAALVLGLL
jgi:hypothetical protein